MRATMVILAKDLRQRLRDSALLVFAIALPLGMAFIFNLILGDTGQGFTARFGVVDQDGGPMARGFTDQVLRPLERDGQISLRVLGSPADAERLAGQKKIDAVFVLPAGFSTDLAAGHGVTLRIIGNVDAPVAVQVAREVGQAFATERRATQIAVAVALRGGAGEPGRAQQLEARAQALTPGVTVAGDASAARRELDSRTYYAAGMAVFFLFFAALFTVTGVLDERSAGTLPRLLAAPVRPSAILAGKLLGGAVVGAASMAVLVVATSLLLGARWGDPLGVAVLVGAAVLAATGVMAVVAVYARSSEQASNWQSVVAMVLGVFGGALFPVAQLGGLATVSYLTPHRWFMQGLADLGGGGSVRAVLGPVAVLLTFAVVGGAIAMLRLGRLVRS